MAAPVDLDGAARPVPNGRHARVDAHLGAAPARPRRHLTDASTVRAPWPVVAAPDTTPRAGEARAASADDLPTTTELPGGADAVTDVTPVRPARLRAVPAAPAAPAPAVPVSGAPARSGLHAVPTVPAPGPSPVPPRGARPAVPGPPPASRPVGPARPPQRAPIRRDHVPGTPVRSPGAVWGPPQPAR